MSDNSSRRRFLAVTAAAITGPVCLRGGEPAAAIGAPPAAAPGDPAEIGREQFRLGKQQVVWGTADGIKLLDIINPTDYREFNQNTFEDSRIPIWMLKAERNITDRSNVQFILTQHEENKIPGLDNQDNRGEAFIMKGVDAITGPVNGFLNITPTLAATAQSFNNAAQGGAFTRGQANPFGLLPFAGLTVDGFASGYWDPRSQPGQILPATPTTGVPGFMLLNNIAQCGLDPTCSSDPNANNNIRYRPFAYLKS